MFNIITQVNKTMYSQSQILPDTYSVPVQFNPSTMSKPNTNIRYKNFNQTHFTIGDEEQFWNHISLKPIKYQHENTETTKTEDNFLLSPISTYNTFKYLFYKFKKGILIQIRNNRVEKFLPFSNSFFVNEWYNTIIDIPNEIKELQNKNEILPTQYWYTNNGLMRYESPINETDTGISQIKHMFEQLCKEEKIPDIDLFVNRRDFPLLKKDRTEPYENIWNSKDKPLVSHNYTHYSPILSMVEHSDFLDLSIPTIDDWSRVMYKENIHFISTKRKIPLRDNFDIPWSKKKKIAVFRGSATGLGITTETNKRLNLCSKKFDSSFMNVGITSKNERYRIHKQQPHKLQKITNYQNIIFKDTLTLEEQSMYKYVIHVEGHVQAFRLSIELSMNSVILLVESDYKLWFEKYLEPWKHYIPVKGDLTDLHEKIKWCINNDEKCQEIAVNAKLFYEQYLCKKNCLKYLRDTIHNLSKTCKRNNVSISLINEQNKLFKTHQYLKDINSFMSRDNYKLEFKRTFVDLQNIKIGKKSHTYKIYESKNTTLLKYSNNDRICYKYSKYQLDYELFIGVNVINNLLKNIPNFIYTLPTKPINTHNQKNCILLEYIPKNYTMMDYIKSHKFNFNEWLFYTIQIILSLSVSQRICYFIHNNLTPWNILLHKTEEESVTDYVTGMYNDIYRVFTKTIPIIIDYDKVQVIHDLQFFTKSQKELYNENNMCMFNDCITYFISCFHNIILCQKLTDSDKQYMFKIFKFIFEDDKSFVNIPINKFEDICRFVSKSNNYTYLTFSSKSEILSKKKPKDIIPFLLQLYKPTFFETKSIHCITKVDSMEFTNFGYPEKKLIDFSKLHPFLQLYWRQKLYKPDDDDILEYKSKDKIILSEISLPIISKNILNEMTTIGSVIYNKKYLNFINILVELLNYGGIYELETDEKDELFIKLKPLLNNIENIINYSKKTTILKINFLK